MTTQEVGNVFMSWNRGNLTGNSDFIEIREECEGNSEFEKEVAKSLNFTVEEFRKVLEQGIREQSRSTIKDRRVPR